MPEFFSHWVWASVSWNLFCLKFFVSLLCKKLFMKLFCKSNAAAHKKRRAVVVLEIHRKLSCSSSICNIGGCRTQIHLKNLKRTSCKSQLFKVTNKGKPPPMIFSLTCNLVKMDVYYSNDFQKIFLARNPTFDCNQIRSNQIAAGVNDLNHFHF